MTYSLDANSPLLAPFDSGAIHTPHRIFMAPLTRSRAEADGTPTDLQVEYYRQRAGAGLIISEATQAHASGGGAYHCTPGLHNDAQQAKWAEIASAVHAGQGQIFVQLWHVGRIGHPGLGSDPVAPSPIAAEGYAHTPEGKQPLVTPRELTTDEIAELVQGFRSSARRAVDAGLDGVEIHSANGYLLHAFLGDDSNARTDAYGGTPENRARFVVEVVRAVVDEIGGDRVGIRFSPGHQVNGMNESDPVPAHREVLRAISDLGLAYVHFLIEPTDPVLAALRPDVKAPVVLNTGFALESDFAQLEKLVADGVADAVAVGRWYIANPDLVDRLRQGAELAEVDQSTLYSAGPKGYTDYPTLAPQSA